MKTTRIKNITFGEVNDANRFIVRRSYKRLLIWKMLVKEGKVHAVFIDFNKIFNTERYFNILVCLDSPSI